ncbi:BamA/TamA family outer membrane protein [Lacinutrix sp.]|uniref:translocation and assembly module lipoprotein TamL n=2 Tax=Lacinutrix sp. TaxID=1937692 RepID=UPI00261CA0B7|nr:BamA/TamA family outer membrane protein [Lacinutrix sp.]MDG1715782.1 BamA/TamA family outer membrane protein [Lacinutrix sp.]
MKIQDSKILFIILIFGFLTSCNSIKRVPKNAHLLTKTTIKVNDKNEESEAVTNLIHQKPNSSIPYINFKTRLYLYNWARPNLDSILKARVKNNPKRTARQTRFLSKKQFNQGQRMKLGFNKWLKETGEAPVIVNDSLSKKTAKRLEDYYWNNGWLDVKTDFETIRNDNQRASVTYKVITGEPYIIDSLSTNIETPVIDSLYQNSLSESLIKPNKQYKTNDGLAERDRITDMLRNSGVYHFSQDNILFKMDSIGKTKKINIELYISEKPIRKEDTTLYEPFKIYKVKDVNIYTNNAFEDKDIPIKDTTFYNGYNIYSKEKLRFNSKMLTDAVFIKPKTLFRDKNKSLTSRRISNLKTFKYPKIEYVENTADTTLTANIYLTPLKRFSLGFSAEASQSNIQTIGFSLNPSLLMRNVFKGAETLELSGIASIGASKDGSNERDQFFDINEIGANLRLTIPRLFSPFNTEKIIPSSMFPSTRISLATTSQTNVGLDKQTATGTFNYRWFPNNKVSNRLDVFNVQFVKNLNTGNYFNVYENSFNSLNTIAINSGYINSGETLALPNQANLFIADATSGNVSGITTTDLQTVKAINERKERLTEENLILATNFSYTKDRRDNLFDNDFSIFRLRLELAGNVLAATSNMLGLQKNNNDKYELFNVAFSQYVKTELDYVKYWDLGAKNVIAIRSFFGIAIPYGNSTNIPFAKSFFGGGANDNRAWSAYNLGPGSTQSVNEFNEANMKIALSAENRFNLFGALNGALFVDAGNIWNVLDDVDDDASTFNAISSIKDIAVGSGFGLRYDFNFFILRGDIGFKTYDPAYNEGNRWFKDYNFANAVYNIGINYPF